MAWRGGQSRPVVGSVPPKMKAFRRGIRKAGAVKDMGVLLSPRLEE
jgi:hypothetical protein